MATTRSTPGTDIATFDPSTSAYPVLFGSDSGGSLLEVVEENFGEDGFSPNDLPVIKVSTGGQVFWNRGDDDPPAKEIEGVIVYWGVARSYWQKGLEDAGEDSGNPPDCSSPDGKKGYGAYGVGSETHPSGDCADCPMNAFGSGRGNSKACKEVRQLWMIFPDSVLPTQVRLPPSSIGPFKKYMVSLTTRGKPYYSVTTKLTLEKAKSGGGVDYARAVAVRGEVLDPAEAAAAKAYGQQIRQMLEAGVQAQAQANAQGSTGNGVNDPWAADEGPAPDVEVPEEFADAPA